MKRTFFCFNLFREITLICHTFLTLKLRLILTSVSSPSVNLYIRFSSQKPKRTNPRSFFIDFDNV
ncbi:hypothetical protein FF021_00725 [Leptospira noguchii]|nr:hypothetical protein FF021_00725 [Leptospira noguchii]